MGIVCAELPLKFTMLVELDVMPAVTLAGFATVRAPPMLSTPAPPAMSIWVIAPGAPKPPFVLQPLAVPRFLTFSEPLTVSVSVVIRRRTQRLLLVAVWVRLRLPVMESDPASTISWALLPFVGWLTVTLPPTVRDDVLAAHTMDCDE